MASSLPLNVLISALKPPIEAALVARILRDRSFVAITIDHPATEQSAELRDADIWVVGYTAGLRVSEELLDIPRRLRGVVSAGMGFDHIDTAAAASRGIPVVNAPEFAISIAEAALTLMLMITKHYPAMQRAVTAGQWPAPGVDRGHTLVGKTLGIIGLGRIGAKLAELGRGLSMRTIAADPFLTADQVKARGAEALYSLHDLMRESDVICVCAPLTKTTHHLIDAAALEIVRPGAYLVNVARGALIDELALVAALESGRLAGAALDVLEQEPPSADHPLLHMPNVIITPHSLGATVENTTIIAESIYISIQELARGERPRNTVNL
jgi:D-3-phosphoglycerate dehydrogenase